MKNTKAPIRNRFLLEMLGLGPLSTVFTKALADLSMKLRRRFRYLNRTDAKLRIRRPGRSEVSRFEIQHVEEKLKSLRK